VASAAFLLGARGTADGARVGAGRFEAAVQRIHDVDDVGRLCRLRHRKGLAGLLGAQHADHGFLVSVAELVGLEVPDCGDDLLAMSSISAGSLDVAYVGQKYSASCRTS